MEPFGELKIRGKRKRILKLLSNEIQCYMTDKEVTVIDNTDQISLVHPETYAAFGINDTRMFIRHDSGNDVMFNVYTGDPYLNNFDDDVYIIIPLGAKHGLEYHIPEVLSKKYKVRIRMTGLETINECKYLFDYDNGKKIKEDKVEYNDFYWDCSIVSPTEFLQ